jgi:shikimate kinase
MPVVFLAGLPGAGKTSVGRSLAAKLGCQFLDLDSEIERQTGLTVNGIFSRDGEWGFRQIESQALVAVLERFADDSSGAVLSLGGGSLLLAAHRALVRRFGKLIYLEASVETLAQRLAQDQSRPLLASGNLLEKLRALHSFRHPQFLAAADHTVAADLASPKDLAERIARLLAE